MKKLLWLRYFLIVIIVISLSFNTAFGEKSKVKPIGFGIHAYDDIEVTKRSVTPLVKYLATILRRPVKLIITKDYEELIRRFVSRELTFAVLPPYAYAKTSRIYDFKLLANLKLNNNSFYRGAIIARRDDDINNIRELEGRKFGFVSKDSASGYLYPVVHMAKLDIKEPDNFFGEVKFLKAHSKVIEALVNKEIDGGTVFEAEILNYSKKGGDISNIKVITRTPQIPFDAFVAQAAIPDSIAKKVTDALIKYKYSKGKLTEKNKLKCWVNPDDSLYNSVREAMKFIKDYREKKVKILKFGMCPRRGAAKELEKLKPFMKYLEKEIGYKIVIKLSPNYLDVGRRLLVGDTDFAILSPFTYIQTADNTKIKPIILAQQSIHNTTTYSAIIVSKNYETLEKLKGKTLALVDPDSASGRLIPTAYFQKNGINLTKYFGKIYYAGSHLKALKDLISDKTDVAAISNSTYTLMMKKNKAEIENLHIIYKSEKLPRESIVTRGDLSLKVIKMLEKALFKLNDKENKEYSEILWQIRYGSFVRATDSVYDSLREIIPMATGNRKYKK